MNSGHMNSGHMNSGHMNSGHMNRHSVIATVLGELTIVASGDVISGVYFPHHWTKPDRAAFGPLVETSDDRLLARAQEQLLEYLEGDRESFDLPVTLTGAPFSQQVWALLTQIPYGTTTTYGELAERLGEKGLVDKGLVDKGLGNKGLAQAVGQAVGHNPLSILVPCHRVVGKDGKLTGYAGGLARKQFLLELEEPELISAGRLF
jgi:methylated-DNA-[protein]-cysteine S-methyltransferase